MCVTASAVTIVVSVGKRKDSRRVTLTLVLGGNHRLAVGSGGGCAGGGGKGGKGASGSVSRSSVGKVSLSHSAASSAPWSSLAAELLYWMPALWRCLSTASTCS